jgi:hypothetical protein
MNFSDYVRDIETFYTANGVNIQPLPKIKADFSENQVLDPLIDTGNYDPGTQTITVYVKNRHLKDILRTLCHELVHHNQYLTNPERFENLGAGKIADND